LAHILFLAHFSLDLNRNDTAAARSALALFHVLRRDSSNLMSLSGIAIAIGVLVDAE